MIVLVIIRELDVWRYLSKSEALERIEHIFRMSF